MKSVIIFLAVLFFGLGCSHSYKVRARNMGLNKIGYQLPDMASEKNFEDTRELANLNKLQAEEVFGDKIRGYLGFIWNEQRKGVSYKIFDPDGVKVAQGFLFPKGQEGSEHEKYLMPTNSWRGYMVKIKCYRGKFSSTFQVSSVIDDVGIKKCHWHIRIKQ